MKNKMEKLTIALLCISVGIVMVAAYVTTVPSFDSGPYVGFGLVLAGVLCVMATVFEMTSRDRVETVAQTIRKLEDARMGK